MGIQLKGTLETNDLSEFPSGSIGAGVAASAAAALAGTGYGLAVTFDGVNQEKVSANSLGMPIRPYMAVRFYLDPNSCTIPNNGLAQVFAGIWGVTNWVLIWLGYKTVGGYFMRTSITNDSGVDVVSADYAISDTAHCIEFDWGYASGPAANDGYYRLYVDDILQYEVVNFDLYHLVVPIDYSWGICTNPTPGCSGTFYMDEIVLDDATTHIGLYTSHTGTVGTYGHERNLWSEYNGAQDLGGHLGITAPAALNGTSYGVQYDILDTTAHWLASAFDVYRYCTGLTVGFWYDPNGWTHSSSPSNYLTIVRVNSGTSYVGELEFYVRYTAAGYDLFARVHDDTRNAASYYDTPVATLSDAPHYVEARVTKASGAGVTDSVLCLYADGALAGSVSGFTLYNDFSLWGMLRVGVGWALQLQAGMSGSWYIDELVIQDQGACQQAPNAVIGGPAAATDCEDVTFDGDGSTDPDGTIEHYLWDFGDGTAGAGVRVTHRYEAGSYTVTLTVTDNDGLTDAATLALTVTACSAAELLSLLGEPSWYQSTELTVAVAPSILNIYGASDQRRFQFRREVVAYSHELRADGGYYGCEFSLTATQNALEEWFENGLGRDVTVTSPGLEVIWNGFVNEIQLELGPLSVTRGPLLELANVISVAYTPLDTSVSPPIAGLHTTYASAIDTASRGNWGPFVKTFSAGQVSVAAATQYANSLLTLDAWPRTAHRLSPAGGNQRVTLRCAGYVRLLEAEPYIAGGLTGTINASDKLIDVLARTVYNTLFTNRLIAANTSQVAADEATANSRAGWEVIKEILAYGDAAYNRYTFTVKAGRRCVYEVIPTTAVYQRRLTDRTGRVYDLSGATVEPWNVEAGKWLFLSDFLVGYPQPTDLRRDPRYMFLESVNWRMGDAAPTLNGAKYTTVAYQLNKSGLAGR